MSDINSIGGPASSATLRAYAKQVLERKGDDSNTATAVLDDSVEISETAAFLNRLAALPDDRARKIVDVRNSILNGSYITDEKLNAVTDRLLSEL